jgi:1-acyl-sn-glycerol-3-phosphate acyltransferase
MYRDGVTLYGRRLPERVQAMVLPLIRRYYSLTVRSPIDLDSLPSSCIFAASHSSHLDSLTVLAALPESQRRATRIAAAADYWYCSPVRRTVAAFFNAFPFSRTGSAGIKRSITLLQQGWSVLLYPSGTRSHAAHFRRGIGLLAACTHRPVIPIAILGTDTLWPKGQWLPRSGSVTIRFGIPMYFDRSLSIGETTHQIETAVRMLIAQPDTPAPKTDYPAWTMR